MKTIHTTPPLLRKLKRICFFIAALLSLSIGKVSAQSDACSTAGTLTEGANCEVGTITASFGAELIDNDDGVCVDPGGFTVTMGTRTGWYQFTTTGTTPSTYTISMDNGSNGYNTDTRMRLYKQTGAACTSAGMELVACSDEGGFHNLSAAQITAILDDSTTYFVVVDLFGNAEGQFCINVFKVAIPANDNLSMSTDITSLISGLSAATPFKQQTEIYNPYGGGTADEPTWSKLNGTGGAGNHNDNADIDCNVDPASFPVAEHNDIWFKFDITSSNKNTFLSVFPTTDVAVTFFGAAIFTIDSVPADSSAIAGFTGYCSTGDGGGSFTHGASGDVGKGSTPTVPRLDLSGLADGTYYLRVYQWLGTSGSLDKANINIVAEHGTSGGVSIDTYGRDRCFTTPSATVGCNSTAANVNFSKTYMDLTNAAMQGNIHSGNGGDPGSAPVSGEPSVYHQNGGVYNDCTTGNTFAIGGNVQTALNNTAIYSFEIKDSTETGTIDRPELLDICAELAAIIDILPTPDELPLITPPQVKAAYIAAYAEVISLNTTLCGPGGVLTDGLYALLCGTLNSVVMTVSTVPVVGPVVAPQLQAIVNIICVDPITVPKPCRAYVRLKFDNISTSGINGNRAYFQVLSSICDGNAGPAVMAGNTETGQTCIELRPTSPFAQGDGFLPNGIYYIVSNGEAGNVLQYDMTLTVQYKDTLTGEACGIDCAPTYTYKRKGIIVNKEVAASSFAFDYVKPVPASDRLEIGFTSKVDGDINMSIMDLTGKTHVSKVSAAAGSNTSIIDVSKLAPGVYFMILNNGKEQIRTKFVKID